jgi:hypothetical protein
MNNRNLKMKKRKLFCIFYKVQFGKKLEITVWFSSHVGHFDVVEVITIVFADVPVVAHQIRSSLLRIFKS